LVSDTFRVNVDDVLFGGRIMKCEGCPEFRGRDKYCACGQWIRTGDMRICSSHPEHPDYTKENRDKHRQRAIECGVK